MSTKLLVVGFTDLKDSTRQNEVLGRDKFGPVLDEHLRVGMALAEAAGGKHIKSIGDAHMVTFDYIEGALRFATELQQFYAAQPCFVREAALLTRVGLYLGAVEPVSGDVFGSGVNRAARVEGLAEPTTVMVNAALVESIATAWGVDKADRYFRTAGEFELKGIPNPPTHKLFVFEWEKYAKENAGDSLAGRVYSHLRSAGVEVLDANVDEIGKPGTIIWPVVPRKAVNAIHRGQLEVIRLMALLGWRVRVLLADCGARKNPTRSEAEEFGRRLRRCAEDRAIRIDEEHFMTDLFDTSYDHYPDVHDKFKAITSEVTLETYLAIINKSYSQTVKDAMRAEATLDSLRPILTCAAVLHLAEQTGTRCLVVAGQDEAIQWHETRSVPKMRDNLAALLIPILEDDEKEQAKQLDGWPIWYSDVALRADLVSEKRNLGAWVFRLHVLLPAFPASTVKIGETVCSGDEWEGVRGLRGGVDVAELAKAAWPILDPRNG